MYSINEDERDCSAISVGGLTRSISYYGNFRSRACQIFLCRILHCFIRCFHDHPVLPAYICTRYQVCLQSRALSLDNADITEAALRPPHTCVRTFVVRPRRVRSPRSGFKLDHHHLSLFFSVSSSTTSSMSTRTLSRLVGSNLRSATSRAPRGALRVRCMASAADSNVCVLFCSFSSSCADCIRCCICS